MSSLAFASYKWAIMSFTRLFFFFIFNLEVHIVRPYSLDFASKEEK